MIIFQKQNNNSNINKEPLKKVVEFINNKYKVNSSFAISNEHKVPIEIKVNIKDKIDDIASKIVKYEIFADLDLENISHDMLSILTTPIGNLINVEINLLFLFVLRDLCSMESFNEITKPLLFAIDSGQFCDFLGNCNRNLILLMDQDTKKDIERYLKPLFESNLPDYIRSTPSAYEYYYSILQFISISSHMLEIFANKTSKLLNVQNSTNMNSISNTYIITWTNGSQELNEEVIDYPTSLETTINGEKYKIKNIKINRTPKDIYTAETFTVSATQNQDFSNLDKLVRNNLQTCNNIENELASHGWRVIKSFHTTVEPTLLNTGYHIVRKGNNLYDITVNLQRRFTLNNVQHNEENKENKYIMNNVIPMNKYI